MGAHSGHAAQDHTPPGGGAACRQARAEDDVRSIDIGPEWVCIRRRIAGFETWVNVPTASYRGVTLRMKAAGTFEIVLLHADASLDVVLAEAADDRDVIARWRSYARRTCLPLLVEDQEGRLQPMRDAPAPQPSQRRGASALKNRRPRFLARRRMGSPPSASVH
jgi:hypothetical protein